MLKRRTLAVGSATVALLIAPAAALAAGTTVTVRVEGAKRTLLAQKAVHTHAGSITKGGTPAGSCPATRAAGALNMATQGRWGGKYTSSLGDIELTSIFGERYSFTSGHFWGIWLNNKFASFGICGQKLKKGDTLLFAPAPDKGNVYPTAIKAPRTARTGSSFKVHVVYYNAAGKATPLAKAHIQTGKASPITNSAGYVTVHSPGAGQYRFTAAEKGYIRPVPVTVRVG